MNKKGSVLYAGMLVGNILEDENGYTFTYDPGYLDQKTAQPISVTLPLQREPFVSKTMIPFFDGLIPEGWLLDIAQETWKIDPRDRMRLLLACCRDCIGAVSIEPVASEDDYVS